MKDERLANIIKRVEKNGICRVPPSEYTRKISKIGDYEVFNNRRMGESIIIDSKRLKKIFGSDFF